MANDLCFIIIVFIIYLSLPRNCWWWKSWGVTWELQTKKKNGISFIFKGILYTLLYLLPGVFFNCQVLPSMRCRYFGGHWKLENQSKIKLKKKQNLDRFISNGPPLMDKYFQFQPLNFIVFQKLVQMKASLSLEHSNKVLSLIVETWDGLVDNLTRSVSIGSPSTQIQL